MNKKALVVEDDSNIAELLRLYLGKDGFEVAIALDGGKAVSMPLLLMVISARKRPRSMLKVTYASLSVLKRRSSLPIFFCA